MSCAETAQQMSVTKDEVQTLEKSAFRKLLSTTKWNYIRYGVAGYMRKRIAEERRQRYSEGYLDGYHAGIKAAENKTVDGKIESELLNQPIETMGLSTHAFRCLRYAGLWHIRDLLEIRYEKICAIRNLGPKTACEIAKVLKEYGFEHTQWEKFLL